MSENLDWNANVEDLEQDTVQEWEFNHRPANDKGESDIIQSRIDPSLGRMVDELIQDCKGRGLPIKTRADFVRLSVFRGVQDVQQYLNNQDEQITNYLLLEKQAMKEAQKSAMLERVLNSVQALTKGLTVLSADYRKDWKEVNKRLTDFLRPVMEIKQSDEFLARLYVTELFEYSRFKEILEKLKEEHNVSQTIKEAELFYGS